MPTALETDYLIVGSGAVGMAFADTLLAETDADIIIVDRFAKPGGHWNVAYPFVTLHQPSAFYGVSSWEMSSGRKDTVGLSAGLNELASGAEVLAYFDNVMRHQFLPTGRVRYFPMCDYQGEGRFTQKLSGEDITVNYKTIVDGTHLNTNVPATHTPNFRVADGVNFIPLNDLPQITDAPEGFVVIGGGKTGIDACLWLLEMGADPDTIRWIVSRDAWLLDRRNTQPTPEFFEHAIGTQAAQFESIAQASSMDDMFDRLEASGYFLRIDNTVRPTMFHGATVTKAEIEELSRIKNVIRMGRVQSIGPDKIRLDQGVIPTGPRQVHVDCSASALLGVEDKPVFQGDKITLQMVRAYQPVFSSAFIAHIEACFDDEAEKNRLCNVVPLPNGETDFMYMTVANMMNQYNWSQDSELRAWIAENRLDGFTHLMQNIAPDDEAKRDIVKRLRANAPLAVMKLHQFIAELE